MLLVIFITFTQIKYFNVCTRKMHHTVVTSKVLLKGNFNLLKRTSKSAQAWHPWMAAASVNFPTSLLLNFSRSLINYHNHDATSKISRTNQPGPHTGCLGNCDPIGQRWPHNHSTHQLQTDPTKLQPNNQLASGQASSGAVHRIRDNPIKKLIVILKCEKS